MIAVDTNILVYAHRVEHEDNHPRARAALEELMNGPRGWAVPWPCVHEFVGHVTNRRIYQEPMPVELALEIVQEWSDVAQCIFLGESAEHLKTLSHIAGRAGVRGSQIHDARIAAICIDHGVSELWTADRDFSRFPDLVLKNPLVG